MGAALREAWLWLLLAFLLGLVIGYFLRKWTVRERTSTDASTTTRIAELEAQLDDCNASKASKASAVEVPVAAAIATPAAIRPAAAKKAPAAKPSAKKTPAARKPAAKSAPLDLSAAKVALGTTVKLDDLKLIEGIGPKIAALFKADGIVTWRDLSKANVERLQGILSAAGPRYNIHNPGSWPKQAGLLADGKWVEFKAITDNLKGGK